MRCGAAKCDSNPEVSLNRRQSVGQIPCRLDEEEIRAWRCLPQGALASCSDDRSIEELWGLHDGTLSRLVRDLVDPVGLRKRNMWPPYRRLAMPPSMT
jgi:hypothetical protein